MEPIHHIGLLSLSFYTTILVEVGVFRSWVMMMFLSIHSADSTQSITSKVSSMAPSVNLYHRFNPETTIAEVYWHQRYSSIHVR